MPKNKILISLTKLFILFSAFYFVLSFPTNIAARPNTCVRFIFCVVEDNDHEINFAYLDCAGQTQSELIVLNRNCPNNFIESDCIELTNGDKIGWESLFVNCSGNLQSTEEEVCEGCNSTPTPTPTPDDEPDICDEMEAFCLQGGGFWKGCVLGCASPIVLDIDGDGFNLTNGQNGVDFDLTGEGRKDRISWTAANSDDAWLVLDRNSNGTIDSFLELFGNFTEQPSSIPVQDRNGFYALAEFDKPENGGNGDGKINRLDTIYRKLRLWQDKNHNGISEQNELSRLRRLDVRAIKLDFKTSKRTDRHGNRFKFRAQVRDSRDANVGKWAWDVFLVRPKPWN